MTGMLSINLTPFNAQIMCRLEKIIIPDADTVVLVLVKGDCVDMSGAIKLAKMVNPTVKKIFCENPGPDVIYRYDERNFVWVCIPKNIKGDAQ